jgi:hypothetical protein
LGPKLVLRLFLEQTHGPASENPKAISPNEPIS